LTGKKAEHKITLEGKIKAVCVLWYKFSTECVKDPKHVKPYLVFDAMIQTVQSIVGSIRYMVSDVNADVDLAKMNIELNCPVLSDDSNFYLPAGFIPYSNFHWKSADNVDKIIAAVCKHENFMKKF